MAPRQHWLIMEYGTMAIAGISAIAFVSIIVALAFFSIRSQDGIGWNGYSRGYDPHVIGPHGDVQNWEAYHRIHAVPRR